MKPISELHILIVDDVRSTRKILTRILHHMDLDHSQVIDVSSGASLQEMLDMFRFDVLICDYHLGDTNAFELLKAVRMDPRTASLPFICMSNSLFKDEVKSLQDLKVSSILVKPLSIHNVRNHISRALEKSANTDWEEFRLSLLRQYGQEEEEEGERATAELVGIDSKPTDKGDALAQLEKALKG